MPGNQCHGRADDGLFQESPVHHGRPALRLCWGHRWNGFEQLQPLQRPRLPVADHRAGSREATAPGLQNLNSCGAGAVSPLAHSSILLWSSPIPFLIHIGFSEI